eukprot:gene3277-4105_t
MKIINILLSVLLVIAVVRADDCTVESCGGGKICYNGACLDYPIPDITLSRAAVGSWIDGSRDNKVFYQYEFTIANTKTDKTMHDIVIGSDSIFHTKVRDGNAYWNIVTAANTTNLYLPAFQTGISPSQSFAFGCIIEGNDAPNMWIKFAKSS